MLDCNSVREVMQAFSEEDAVQNLRGDKQRKRNVERGKISTHDETQERSIKAKKLHFPAYN